MDRKQLQSILTSKEFGTERGNSLLRNKRVTQNLNSSMAMPKKSRAAELIQQAQASNRSNPLDE